ncbi:sporulation histidine kinase inhibitor Sda [Halalkalibacter alkaliphilus]|uniref:Sporulation histidine kinase inhibitor Sda n=1 Tax=Halalkalibacter alkaliphilus TaxID=2917993 RepID=A0A9X2I564_9BACI|nr:sporulation histidine kinase inhibitor Sda [Halalkalibacter alkaliphilus]MCL7747893.1 sporulation histidine kinase inhibitor Sda [Halalkalibacter alkaliphilus]
MERLEYRVLLEAYERAIRLELEEDFIELLREEIKGRKKRMIISKKSKIFV